MAMTKRELIGLLMERFRNSLTNSLLNQKTMYKYNFWNKSIARLKKLRQIAKADDGVHSIEEILLAKKAVKKPKEKFDLKGFIEISKKVRRVIDEENQPSSEEECEKFVEKSKS